MEDECSSTSSLSSGQRVLFVIHFSVMVSYETGRAVKFITWKDSAQDVHFVWKVIPK